MQIQTSSTSTSSLPLEWIEKLFNKMSLDYGKRFVDQWAGADPDELFAHWARELATYSRDELVRGYNALSGRDWPPTLPEFKRMCRPPVDPTVAYYEALEQGKARERGEMGNWSHPAIYWAWNKIGAFDFNSLTYSNLKSRWEGVLADEMAKEVWPNVPEPRVALMPPEKAKITKEEANKRIAEFHEKGLMKPTDEKTDHKRWAKRIIERADQGDKTISVLQLKFAKEALSAS